MPKFITPPQQLENYLRIFIVTFLSFIVQHVRRLN